MPTDEYLVIGARLEASPNGAAGASTVLAGVLAVPDSSTDIGTLYVNAPNGNGCKLGYTVFA